MGVPALFRWLSKKYPRIIEPVIEDPVTVKTDNDEEVEIPINMADTNPNGQEFDNLYLDMNGIVHPCTHPEGKPPPETEEEMMVEIFKYTERVVNMVRPRKLLFMAIDGVAPRAKMNQQRSRRFRAAAEAKDKEEARQESILMWESMGKTVTQDEKEKKSWDSNAITPGTPFMDLLAASLRYWVVQKMNSDPGWKNIQVIISDASVPGEGEHKIMSYIRCQRVNEGHDPNTKHVIYGLDADLIMLALATHEPFFKVLREDVFSDANSTGCRKCGKEGHYAAQCQETDDAVQQHAKTVVTERKPFIFLDVSTLREYLEVELDIPQTTFPFEFERALDDWVVLIFFVGNDFLPHLPSLEIREGAIDTLLRIWKQELPRMGGYLTNHGRLELARVQIILEGLAKREDDIFKRRQEAETRQNNNKRRRLDNDVSISGNNASSRHPLPERPNDFAAKADSIGLGGPQSVESLQNMPAAQQALAGSNSDVVRNIRAIRMANMSAAEVLKAELAGDTKPSHLPLPAKPTVTTDLPSATLGASPMSTLVRSLENPLNADVSMSSVEDLSMVVDDRSVSSAGTGTKRKHEDEAEEDDVVVEDVDATMDGDEDEAEPAKLALKVNADGTVEQEDTVKLYEPGYKDRYYRQKFGKEPSDVEFRKHVAKCYVEGMAWVLAYYYQGAPSWQWYYPFHFAPFAADFSDIEDLDITFELGNPFKPYEQLMGVFPAASRVHIPEPFHQLMTEEESPIIDFYPETFQIDMNGKKMAWQGVALLPFIDPPRLLEAMSLHYPKLSEAEVKRNTFGNNVIFASDEHPIYPFYEKLYGKRKEKKPVALDPKASKGINGSVLANPDCIPGSTYYSPLSGDELGDIKNDSSLSVLYFFPEQITPHRSVLLPGVKRPARVLQAQDLEHARSGGRGRGRGGGRGNFNQYQDRPRDPFHANLRGGGDRGFGRGGGGGGGNGRGRGNYAPASYNPPQRNNYNPGGPPPPQQYGGGGGGYGAPAPAPVAVYGGGGDYGGGGGYGNGGGAYGGYGGQGAPRGAPRGGGGYGGGRGGYGGGGGGYGGYGQAQAGYNAPPGGYGAPPAHSGYGGGPPARGGYGGYGQPPPDPQFNRGRGTYNNNRGGGRGW